MATATDPESSPLVINEFLTSNGDGVKDEDGESSDWIEIYNRSASPVNLAGYALTDDPTNPQKWMFPALTLDSQEYLLVFASGKNRTTTEVLHTNFRLNKDGDFLGLYNILEGRFADTLSPTYPSQFRDISYGLLADGLTYGYLNTPTPGAPNEETLASAGAVAPVTFSVERGYYDRPFTVELSTTTPGAAIHYTTDGSTPSESHGALYREPLTFDRTTILRAVAFKPEYLPSPVQTHTYLFTNSAAGRDHQVKTGLAAESRPALPVLSLVTSNGGLAGLQAGSGRQSEQLISVELFDSAQTGPGFQANAGLRQYGLATTQPAFQLFFRGEYGATMLEYPLFPDAFINQFDTLLLQPVDVPNQWLRDSQVAMSNLGSHGVFVNVYINGKEWGLYNLIERPDAAFMASYLGGQEEMWFIANRMGPLYDNLVSPQADILNDLFTLLTVTERLHGELSTSLDDVYAAVAAYLDPAQLSDYVILRWYAESLEWPEPNWYAAIRLGDLPGQGKLLIGERAENQGQAVLAAPGNPQKEIIRRLFEISMENPDFKIQFADRLYRHLFNNGALVDVNAQNRWQRLHQSVEPGIAPGAVEDWREMGQSVAGRMSGQAERLIERARQAGYYPPIDPPLLSQEGGLLEAGVVVTLALPHEDCRHCTIYVTTDGSDPRFPVTGAVSPGAAVYTDPLPLDATIRLKARILYDDPASAGPVWSALTEASFNVVKPDYELRISEIMYNPAGGDDYEFIEFENVGDQPLDLAYVSLDEGIYFMFPPNSPPLLPGEVRVLVSNAAAFAERYPDVPIDGVYEGHLSNKGEKLILSDAEGQPVLELEYRDDGGWPVTPDGRGDSLVLAKTDGDPNDPRSWRASPDLNGSPGAIDQGL